MITKVTFQIGCAGREWSEVEHLLQVPAESDKEDDDDEDACMC